MWVKCNELFLASFHGSAYHLFYKSDHSGYRANNKLTVNLIKRCPHREVNCIRFDLYNIHSKWYYKIRHDSFMANVSIILQVGSRKKVSMVCNGSGLLGIKSDFLAIYFCDLFDILLIGKLEKCPGIFLDKS